ncbi:hypothetical protein [Novosphingobium sp. B1]|uniref:hypothetical protein n=1 Tax=Novosphingobium sp. B1 TaxID=1938756 RepID=UPI000A040433|nr:hypothetical protein [Novosphingobium sp. B1]
MSSWPAAVILALTAIGPSATAAAQTNDAVQVRPADGFDRLAAALVAQDRMIAQARPFAAATVATVMEKDKELASLNEEFPGLDQAIVEALEPLMKDAMTMAIPLYREDLANLYRKNLSVEDANTTAEFWSSPIGSNALDEITIVRSNQSVINSLVAEQNPTTQDLAADDKTTVGRFQAEVSERSKLALIGFYLTDPGKNLFALNPEKQKIDAKWVAYSPPGMDKQIEQVIMVAMTQHIAKTDPELAALMAKNLGLPSSQ